MDMLFQRHIHTASDAAATVSVQFSRPGLRDDRISPKPPSTTPLRRTSLSSAPIGKITMASLALRPIISAAAASTALAAVGSRRRHAAGPRRRRAIITCKAEPSGGNSTLELAAGAAGLASCATVAWSLYTLNTTGCGLPPGPGGSLGAAEGVSYLVVAGLVGWSVTTKARTGSGLPAGPYGLLGAAEGVAYLTVAAIAVVFGLQFFQQGSIPGPLPSEQCFG